MQDGIPLLSSEQNLASYIHLIANAADLSICNAEPTF
jgi:hypothetical protein